MRLTVRIIVLMQATPRSSLVAIVTLLVAATVAGCGSAGDEDPAEDPNLVALNQEKIATFSPGGRLVLSTEQTDHTSWLYPSKPTEAQVRHVFAFRDPERARRGRVAAVEAAQASGWKLSLEREDESPIFGRKRLATGGVTLIIGWYEDDDEGVHKVSIKLQHQPCGRGRCLP